MGGLRTNCSAGRKATRKRQRSQAGCGARRRPAWRQAGDVEVACLAPFHGNVDERRELPGESKEKCQKSGLTPIRRGFEAQHRKVSQWLALRFREDVDNAVEHSKASPSSAGHFLNTGSQIVKEVRRRNLSSFPFFILYGVFGERRSCLVGCSNHSLSEKS